MESKQQSLNEWSQKLITYHIPRWEELPDIDLYMDQVISLIERYLDIFENDKVKIITPAMVNNYVKLGLIPAPIKKKYNRRHVAHLIAITLLKQVITIQEVRDGILYQFKIYGARESFNQFCIEQEYALKVISAHVGDGKIEPIFPDKITPDMLALKMATMSFASKLVAEKIISIQNQEINNMKEEEVDVNE